MSLNLFTYKPYASLEGEEYKALEPYGSFKNMEMPCYVLFLISLFPKPWISQIKQDINLFFFFNF